MKRRTWIWLGVCFVALFSGAWIKRPRTLRAEFAAADIELKPIPLGPTPWAGHQLLAENANAFEVSEQVLLNIYTFLFDHGIRNSGRPFDFGPRTQSLNVHCISTQPSFWGLGRPRRVWIVRNNDEMAKMYFEPAL